MKYDKVLGKVAKLCESTLQSNLVGVYLHGSLAFGCFNENESDIDFLIVTKKEPTRGDKLAICKGLSNLWDEAPPKGFEMSIITYENAKIFTHPCHFELHLSSSCLKWYRNDPEDFVDQMLGEDGDLATHCRIVKEFGVALVGQPIEQVFGEVSNADYLDSISTDITNAHDAIIENPVYYILNLCRVVAFVEEGIVTSKKSGGEWALEHLPLVHRNLVQNALDSYANSTELKAEWSALQSFADFMLEKCPEPQHLDDFMM